MVRTDMPQLPGERQYRSMAPLTIVGEGVSKRFDTDYYVEGYASTFNDPYVLHDWGDWEYVEIIDPDAFRDADMSDIIMQFDHQGKVYARMSNHTLIVEPDQHGLFVAADLGKTTNSRMMWEDIDAGLVTKMSWGFTIAPDGLSYVDDESEHRTTATITRVEKVFDVSAVSLPADPNTEISARSLYDGAIERVQEERLLRETAQRERARSLLALKAKAVNVRTINR